MSPHLFWGSFFIAEDHFLYVLIETASLQLVRVSRRKTGVFERGLTCRDAIFCSDYFIRRHLMLIKYSLLFWVFELLCSFVGREHDGEPVDVDDASF